jgi:endo-1,4-beta-xylanase
MIKIFISFATITTSCFFAPVQIQAQIQDQQPMPSLKETFKNEFLIGTALNTSQILEKDVTANKLIIQQFSAATPENIMEAEIISRKYHEGRDHTPHVEPV